MVGGITRRITTLVLIAALLPAPGLAWHVPVPSRSGTDALAASREFAHALNNTHQAVGSGAVPQVYLVFNVDVPLLPAGIPTLITEESAGWYDEFLKELTTLPVTTGATATTTAPAFSILDDIAAGDAHVLSLESARKLASMPDSVPFEGNPNQSVPVEQSMRVAISDALQEAGFEGSGSTKSGSGTVTYTDELADGDIVVTGRLVDGRIVLTKEFKPLTGGGNVGETVRIRGTQTSSTTGAPPADTQSSGNQTAAVNAPESTPVIASAAAYNRGLINELETKVRVITPNQTNAALMGQINIRDTYVAQMNNLAAGFETLLKDPAQLDAVVAGLRRDAAAVDDAYQNMLGAERAVATLQGQNPRVDLKGLYEADLRRAAQLDAAGNTAEADRIRAQASNTAYGNYVERQQVFYQALDQNPLLGLGERSLVGPDDFLFKKIRNTLSYNAPNSDYVSLVRPYFERAATEARNESTRAAAVNTPAGFLEFGAPKYERTRAAMAAEGRANGSTLPVQLGEAAQGAYEQVEGGKAIRTEITNFGLNLVAGTAWVIPVIGPFISGGAAAIQVVREGDDLVVAVLDAEDARNLAGVTGYTRIITAEDRVAAERGEFVLSVAGLALEGLQGLRVVQGPLPAGAGNATGDATAAGVRSTPTGTPATTGGARTVRPTDAPDRGTWEPGTKPTDADDAVRRANTRQNTQDADMAASEVEAEIRLAREAGVSEDVIKGLTTGYDPNGLPLNNRAIADSLMVERLQKMGYDVNMSPAEFQQLQGMSVRSNPQGAGLSAADMEFLRNQVANNPAYFDTLSTRGYVTGTSRDPFYGRSQPQEGFIAGLNPEAARNLRDAYLKNGGTIPDAPANVDATGTVRLAPGTVPPTVRTGPEATAPTVRLGPEATAPTVRLGPEATAPTVRLGPEATAPTVRLGPEATAPTVRLGPEATAPTVRLGPEATAPTVRLGPEATAPTVRLGPEATAPTVRLDPSATARMVDELTDSLPKSQQAGLSPKQVANDVRAAITRLGVAPQQLARTLVPRLSSRVAKSVAMADLGNTAAPAAPGLDVSLAALGVSSGEAFTVTAVNNGTAPVQLRGEGIVVEPIIGAAAKQGARISRPGAATSSSTVEVSPPIVTQTVEAFCLERVRPVAPPGTQYRVAAPAVQARHRGLVSVLHAAQRVSSAGLLRPDSEIKGYFNFVRQWSIWTRQENFDEKRFTEEFLNQTKKNVESQNVKWTDAMQATVRKAAPGRFRDIRAILDEANNPKIQAAAGAESPARPAMQTALDIAAGTSLRAAIVRRRRCTLIVAA